MPLCSRGPIHDSRCCSKLGDQSRGVLCFLSVLDKTVLLNHCLLCSSTEFSDSGSKGACLAMMTAKNQREHVLEDADLQTHLACKPTSGR